eukprot:CAMPEP_0178448254 /NCGR_PEP_ID=MMETSP0689_2-20121128/41877_1 /TAXON_ID=160604 /ORGANISM="Amphidinium massartii, Strain CS-259" /LENGTH=173 /DNA_ID=CAMNT_0020073409 /DNA_START=27 /DNA_END=544 /DNA_ORIENTATION=-
MRNTTSWAGSGPLQQLWPEVLGTLDASSLLLLRCCSRSHQKLQEGDLWRAIYNRDMMLPGVLVSEDEYLQASSPQKGWRDVYFRRVRMCRAIEGPYVCIAAPCRQSSINAKLPCLTIAQGSSRKYGFYMSTSICEDDPEVVEPQQQALQLTADPDKLTLACSLAPSTASREPP